MNREARIFLITHGYPLFACAQLELGYKLLGSTLDELLFNIMPGLFSLLIVFEWIKRSNIKLSKFEKRCFWYFIISVALFHLYYCICTIMNATGNHNWVINHNLQFTIFILITVIFYLYAYSNEIKRWL